ncbi:MAG: U32 family peptidase [Phycisphaerae bacterium]|nr:U32 family peptidase [Phycisphaerae bacterium]
MELLAPAGNIEKLRYAIAYGADSVYFGCEFGSLRSFAGNFTLDEAREGLTYLHEKDKKGYVTLNIYPFSDEYEKLIRLAKELDAAADGFIVADMGVLSAIKEAGIKTDIHISTQANTTSWQACLAYSRLRAKRVNLARELSFEQIKEIQRETAGKIETEVFIHGSVCFSYSGRCAMSDYMTGFRANRGECKHPCRWKYAVVEEKREGEYMPVFEDERGLYLFNSKDLALFEYVKRLREAGVSSIKIEGRMKSIHYIAAVVSFYRQVLDGVEFSRERALDLLGRVPNRGYSEGFMKGSITPDDYSVGKSISRASSRFVGNVIDSGKGKSKLMVRNKIIAGERLEVLRPDGKISQIALPEPMVRDDGKRIEFANNPQIIVLDAELPEFTILCRVDRNINKGQKDEKV